MYKHQYCREEQHRRHHFLGSLIGYVSMYFLVLHIQSSFLRFYYLKNDMDISFERISLFKTILS